MRDSHTSYEVTTSTSLPGLPRQPFSVRRRFKDFVTFSKALPALLPGCFVPPRPKRNLMEGRRALPLFVEARRAALERYLNKLAAHPQICRHEVSGRWWCAPGAP